jgi:hypothetical protein
MEGDVVAAGVGGGLVVGLVVGIQAGRWWEATARAWILARATRRAVAPRYREAWALTRMGLGCAGLVVVVAIVAVLLCLR